MATIFALSSGAPPAGIGIIRVSGPQASVALQTIAGLVPAPRRAVRRAFADPQTGPIDDGMVLFFPGPHSVTGEDLAEFHCHGGRAVVAALEAALATIDGCRKAEPGEFTRRAFANGRVDLAEAEGLADLLSAETELQRRSALVVASGRLTRQVEAWREQVLGLSAAVEAVLDFSDEDDVTGLGNGFVHDLVALRLEVDAALAAPHAETLREGFRVALAGPPNAGKSTLFNALVQSDAAITTDIPGTTRDVLVHAVAIEGLPFSFVDMAGLRDDSADAVEAIGIARATQEIARADLVLWLGPEGEGPVGAWEIAAQCDRPGCIPKQNPVVSLSAHTGEGMAQLVALLVAHARQAMPKPGEYALNARQRMRLGEFSGGLADALAVSDPLLVAEGLRRARRALDALQGHVSTEDVLDTVFGRFCIGK